MRRNVATARPAVLGTVAKKAELEAHIEGLKAKIRGLTTDSQIVGKLGALEVARVRDRHMTEINTINDALSRFEIVTPATDAWMVAIGTVVTYRQDDSAKTSTVEIGEFMSTDPKVNPPRVSYDSTILTLALMGHREGDEFELELHNGKMMWIEIVDIRLPMEAPALAIAS